MRQISNRQQSVSYLYYFFLGLCLTAEPFFLKQFFETYFPDFHYRALTVSISVVVGIVGFLKLKEANGDTTIQQTVVTICKTYANLLNPKFRKSVLSHYKICCRVLPDLLMSPFSQEPAVHVRSKKALKYFGSISIFFSLLFVCVCYLFLINLPRWGLFETSKTSLFYFFWICLTGIVLTGLPKVIDAAKQLRNGRKSESDLNALLKMLREELRDWQFEPRKVFPTANSTTKGNDIDRDVDVLGISPDNNYFAIELKSHIGNVFWISRMKNLRRQFGRNQESIPFDDDFFDQLHGGARRAKKYYKLSREPEKILLFWRATVKINKNNRVKRGVLISNKEMLVRDLIDRNNDLSR